MQMFVFVPKYTLGMPRCFRSLKIRAVISAPGTLLRSGVRSKAEDLGLPTPISPAQGTKIGEIVRWLPARLVHELEGESSVLSVSHLVCWLVGLLILFGHCPRTPGIGGSKTSTMCTKQPGQTAAGRWFEMRPQELGLQIRP